MKGVAHYKKDGSVHEGGTHKMPNGDIHTGEKHNAGSEKLFHFDELSSSAKKVAKNKTEPMKGKPKKKTAKKKVAKKKAAKPSRTSFAENVEKRMGY